MTSVMHMTAGGTSQPPSLADLLRTAGMSIADVQIWVHAVPFGTVYEHAATVLEWAGAGFRDQDEALLWHNTQYLLDEALTFSAAGFTPAQATRLGSYAFGRVFEDKVDDQLVLQQESAWLGSGLPAEWILFFVDCGVHEAAEGLELYKRTKTDPDEIVRLGLLRGFKRKD